jgi:hypothetical protein
MTMKEKLLAVWILVLVIAAILANHFAGHLLYVLETCFAMTLSVLRS